MNSVVDMSSEGAAQSAIQYFENMRNFLVAVGKMQLLTFEASDLEKVRFLQLYFTSVFISIFTDFGSFSLTIGGRGVELNFWGQSRSNVHFVCFGVAMTSCIYLSAICIV